MTTAYLSALKESALFNKECLLDIEDDYDQIDEYYQSTPFEDWINEKIVDGDCAPQTSSTLDDEILDAIRIFYPEDYVVERQDLTNIILKLKTIFSKDLSSVPARIDPFELEVKANSDWFSNNRNKQSSRLQSLSKQYAVQKFINKAIATNVIRPSQADAWSQILLTPKADGTWRFCVDFRSLNAVTKSMGWPIPNIAQLLQRIGDKKPLWFAVLDLTSGYHQAPLSERSVPLTAFMCSEGLFEWLRLPMGLKGAGSYFQHHMTNTVLRDLVQKICEVY